MERSLSPWSPQDWFNLIAMYERLGIHARPLYSTQSPSLRTSWTADRVPRWTLVSGVGQASTCRCRAACINWQWEKKSLCAMHERATYFLSLLLGFFLSSSLFLICFNQVISPSDNTSALLLCSSTQHQLSLWLDFSHSYSLFYEMCQGSRV